MRTAVLRNPRAHLHGRRGVRRGEAGPPVAAPTSPEGLREVLAGWAASGLDRLVIDGGDGTVREVVSALPDVFGARPPQLAVLPAGKTNALAFDLGVPRGWTVEAALRARGETERAPLEVTPMNGTAPVRRGFLWGAGAFTDAVAMAQHLHAAGLFGALAVGVALAAAGARALLGGRDDPWRAGRPMRLALDGEGGDEARARFLLLMSTLERLPLGLAPFGPSGAGRLRLLDVDAPPRRLLAALPPVLGGRAPGWLEGAGYRRRTAEAVRLTTEAPFILDGELFPGGDLLIRRATPLRFVTP